jgi:signal peptide peptidase SppA
MPSLYERLRPLLAQLPVEQFRNPPPVVPVIRLSGPIGQIGVLRAGLALSRLAGVIERAFAVADLKAVALVVNSPGGSAVQSALIAKRIRDLATEKNVPVYAFVEDVAASGGYWLACAADEIYVNASSIVGSIGVISAGFGLDKLIDRFGIERRVHTAGKDKGALDPFRPERPEDVALLKGLQRDVHDVFIGVVKERRAGKLSGSEDDLFSGSFWAAGRACDMGLIDGIGDLRSKMRELHGEKVRLKAVPLASGGLLSRFRRFPSFEHITNDGFAFAPSFADDLISAVEARALWSRFGL